MLPNRELQFLIYNTPQEDVKVDVVVKDETLFLTQKSMTALFDVGVPAVNKHLTNIFEDGELQENSVVSILEITASDGKNYKTKFYSLDAIIAVGYRVNSKRATDFRIWATKTLKEFITKGFVLDKVQSLEAAEFCLSRRDSTLLTVGFSLRTELYATA